jgi:excisionase family DNA binding protein
MARNDGQLSLEVVFDSSEGQSTSSRPNAPHRTLPRLSIGPREAAEMLGVSRDFFDEHVKPELRIIRRGRKMILIPVAELQRWVEESAARLRC